MTKDTKRGWRTCCVATERKVTGFSEVTGRCTVEALPLFIARDTETCAHAHRNFVRAKRRLKKGQALRPAKSTAKRCCRLFLQRLHLLDFSSSVEVTMINSFPLLASELINAQCVINILVFLVDGTAFSV